MSFVPAQLLQKTGFDELVISSAVPLIELKSTYGLSALRDVQTVAGTGAISQSGGEYELSTGTTTASSAQLDSAERGRYVPGSVGQVGIGVRFAGTITGTADAKWGYFDTEDGFGFGVDSTGVYVFTRRASSDTKVYQTSWNADQLDGAGNAGNPSGLTLSLAEGNIFRVNYTWYGYGTIEFQVVLADSNNDQKVITVHKFSPSQQVSVQDPNLPIAAVVNNGDTTTDYDLYVGGRQYSTYTPYDPNRRVNGDRRLALGSVGTTFVPLISFRRKSAFDSVSVKVDGFDIITDGDLVWELRTGVTAADLTNESFGTPTNITAAETACESDIAATAITNASGEFLDGGLIDASGAGGTSSGSFTVGELNFDVIGTEITTLQVRTLTSTATVSAFLRWKEEW